MVVGTGFVTAGVVAAGSVVSVRLGEVVTGTELGTGAGRATVVAVGTCGSFGSGGLARSATDVVVRRGSGAETGTSIGADGPTVLAAGSVEAESTTGG
jgi:hypothetical protein